MANADERILRNALEISRSKYLSWGKEIIFAIDADNPAKLIRTFQIKKHLGANLNEQTTRRGYGGYAWTMWLHKHLGDTALHIALKQKKILCVHALLLIEASQSIQNDDGLFANDLALEIYGKSLQRIRQDSEHELIGNMHPRDYFLLPDLLIYRNLSPQSNSLMEQGRCEYSKPPLSHQAILRRLQTKQSSVKRSQTNSSFQNSLDDDDLSESVESSSYAPKKGYLREVMNQHNSSMSLLSSADNLTQDHRSLLGHQKFSIFCYNSIEDVVDLLRRQAHLLSRFDAEERLKKSGLSLLAGENNDDPQGGGSVVSGAGGGGSQVSQEMSNRFTSSVSNEREKIVLEAQKSLSSYAMLSKILAGEKKKIQHHVSRSQGAPAGPSLTRDNVNYHQQNYPSTPSPGTRPGAGSVNGNGGGYLSCLDMPYRHITSLSTRTNLIHMNIGDQGIAKICKVLPGNSFIESLVLSTARITSVGFQDLIEILSSLPNLTYLDLSQNAIDDEGAHGLAMALSNSKIMNERISLEKITLMGNRVTSAGAKALVGAVLMSNVHYLK
jgi:hypothetical protein